MSTRTWFGGPRMSWLVIIGYGSASAAGPALSDFVFDGEPGVFCFLEGVVAAAFSLLRFGVLGGSMFFCERERETQSCSLERKDRQVCGREWEWRLQRTVS